MDRSESYTGKTAFVFGSTGYTGQALIQVLAKNGVKTIGHVRADSPVKNEMQERYERIGVIFDDTPWELSRLIERLDSFRPDAIWFLIGTTRKRMKAQIGRGGNPRFVGYDAIDYGLTELCISATKQSEAKARFVYLSATGTGPNSKTAYMRARYKAEKALLSSGIGYAIARPAIISGSDREESRPLERIGALTGDVALAGLGLFGMKNLKNRFASLDAERLACALIHLGYSSEWHNRIAEADDLRILGNTLSD